MKLLEKIKKKIFACLFAGDVTISPSCELMDFVIIITGASRGIGKAVAEVLYSKNANVVLVSRNLRDLKEAFRDFDPKRVLLIEADVTREEEAGRVVKETADRFGKVDVLINNAGIFLEKPFDEISMDDFNTLIDVNVKGVFLMARAVLPEMKKRKDGFIVNIGSKISRNANVKANKVLYATSKCAIEGMSLSLNNELKEFGIRVTCLMPGTAKTFLSLKANEFLSPYRIGEVIAMLIKFKDVDFENLVIKSKQQSL